MAKTHFNSFKTQASRFSLLSLISNPSRSIQREKFSFPFHSSGLPFFEVYFLLFVYGFSTCQGKGFCFIFGFFYLPFSFLVSNIVFGLGRFIYFSFSLVSHFCLASESRFFRHLRTLVRVCFCCVFWFKKIDCLCRLLGNRDSVLLCHTCLRTLVRVSVF